MDDNHLREGVTRVHFLSQSWKTQYKFHKDIHNTDLVLSGHGVEVTSLMVARSSANFSVPSAYEYMSLL